MESFREILHYPEEQLRQLIHDRITAYQDELQLSILRTQLPELLIEITRLKNENTQLKEKNAQLENQIERQPKASKHMEGNAATRHVTSLFFRPLPRSQMSARADDTNMKAYPQME